MTFIFLLESPQIKVYINTIYVALCGSNVVWGGGGQRDGENFVPKKEANETPCSLSVLVIKTDST